MCKIVLTRSKPTKLFKCVPNIVMLCVIGIAAVACGGAGDSQITPPSAVPAQLEGLPAPADIAKSGQYINAYRTILGANSIYIGGGYEDNVTPDGTKLLFTPNYGAEGFRHFYDAARAGFRFNVTEYYDLPQIQCEWVTPPDYSQMWFGLADWSANRWNWYQTDGPVLELPSLDAYMGIDGVYVVMVLLGSGTADLASVRLGPELWRTEVVDDPEGGNVGRYTSLALDNAGLPHIAYYDDGNTALKYAYSDDAAWHVETVDDSTDAGMYASLALDANFKPHIAYMDSTNIKLRYASYNGATWDFETILPAENAGYSCTLAFNSVQQPCIAFYNATAALVQYARYDGLIWQVESVGPGSTINLHISMKLDSSDNPHLAYPFGDNQKYAFFDGLSWQIEDVSVGLRHGSDGEHALAFDSTGVPHIILYDLLLGYPYYASRTGGVWSEEMLPAPHNTGTSGSLAFNSADVPFITCFNIGLELFTKPGGTWQHVRVDSQGWVGHYTSLVLDSLGSPCVSYYHPGDQSLRFARYLPPT